MICQIEHTSLSLTTITTRNYDIGSIQSPNQILSLSTYPCKYYYRFELYRGLDGQRDTKVQYCP